MSNISSSDAWSVKLMRWVARFLSVSWAYWALFWTWFVLASLTGEGHFSKVVFIIIMIIVALMFIGAAIIASVWGKEVFGGGMLLVDAVLIIASIVIFCLTVPGSGDSLHPLFWMTALVFVTMVLPPLVAGSLFLACHRRSKTSREQHV